MYDFPIGPKCLKVAHVINVQKSWNASLPAHGNNSEAMWTYGVMHGSYGILWFMKHCAFPDHTFEQYQTIGSAAFYAFYWVHIVYRLTCWLPGSAIVMMLHSRQWEEPSKLRRYRKYIDVYHGCKSDVSIRLSKNNHAQICAQKTSFDQFWALFSYTRSPNYFWGDFTLFIVCNSYKSLAELYPFVVILPCLTIFPARIWQKEMSLRKKPGWTEYKMRSLMCLYLEFLGLVIFL
ncbi:hypothetical protein ACHAWO_007994 [Cyclotella atomus]|uniref:Uncharacterized protein n=1 Tax=Cyclotella atomus TaxID=382360 RepID=A0ABD3PCZ6_9STRA